MSLEAIVNPANLIAALAAGLLFATIFTIAMPILKRDGLDVRLKSVATRREELRRKSREALARDRDREGSLRHQDEGLYKTIVDRLQLSQLLEDPKVIDKLAQAGLRGPRPVTAFYFFRFALPFAFAAVAA